MTNEGTVLPYLSIGTVAVAADHSVAAAISLMEEHGVRHLPVMKDGIVIGEISERDLRVWQRHENDAGRTPISHIMVEDPYVISSKASLEEVATEMATRKIGCAVVVDRGHLVGMFTVTDALRALARLAPAT